MLYIRKIPNYEYIGETYRVFLEIPLHFSVIITGKIKILYFLFKINSTTVLPELSDYLGIAPV